MSSRESLTDSDKEFIAANYNGMSVLQMAIRLGIKTENRKCSIIEDYVQQAGLSQPLQVQVSGVAPISIAAPPTEDGVKQIAHQIASTPPSVEVQVDDTDMEDDTIESFAAYVKSIGFHIRDVLSERERRDITFLLAQLSSTRFRLMYKSLRGRDYKRLFKEEFVKSMYGKSEMPTEEVNDFMDLAQEAVFQHDTKCKIADLEKIRDKRDTSTAQRLVLEQVIADLNKQYGDSIKRAGEIKKTLGAHREQRLKENRAVGLTITLLLEAVYNTEKREELLRLQSKSDQKLQKVISELEELDATKALIMGISPEELRDGAL